MLTTDIPKIVKSIENSTEVLVAKVREEERQAELRRQEWAAQQEKRRQEEDRRRVAESIKESREELAKAIEDWARVVSRSFQESRVGPKIYPKSSARLNLSDAAHKPK